MDHDIEDLAIQLSIDRNALDQAVIEQPTLFYAVADAAASARDELEATKIELDDTAAEVANQLRVEADQKGARTTEGRISEQVTISEQFRAASHVHREAKLQAERANNLREAFMQRASMLKVLADLYASQYFTASTVSAGARSVTTASAEAGRHAMTTVRRGLSKKEKVD